MTIYETLPSGIVITDYHPRYAPSISEMWNLSSEDWGGGADVRTPGQIISEHESSSNLNTYLALDGDTVVGYCSFGRFYADANTMYIPLLGVRTDYKGKKIGKALVLQCVKRTIELGYPRLDLYTWSGNTDAVPLYKKCGFQWEDKPNSTHLVNFIPGIVNTPLFASFFEKVDWYEHSTRTLEIEPDGVKEKDFEYFTYTWEKDGETLAIGYEGSGRTMYLVETHDYKIQLVAAEHKLAFGTQYPCTFVVENKTGQPLDIEIKGLAHENITLDCHFSGSVTGRLEIEGSFFIAPITKPHDKDKVHPSVLADVTVNGLGLRLGLGIEPKFPLTMKLIREAAVDRIGQQVATYINIESAFLDQAQVTFTMPQNSVLAISETFTTDIPPKGRVSLPTTATTLAIDMAVVHVQCHVTLATGEALDIDIPCELTTSDLTHAYGGEGINTHILTNGPWRIGLRKDDNNAYLGLAKPGKYPHHWFVYPRFGKPYDDEFNLIAPTVKTYQEGAAMVMETTYASQKYPGMVVTQVYHLYASGLATRYNRIENQGTTTQHVMLSDTYEPDFGNQTIFSYQGHISSNQEGQYLGHGGGLIGLENLDPDGFDENWFFEANDTTTAGFCWPKGYKVGIQWGEVLFFEIDPGALAPGQIYETQPVTYALGLFHNYKDMRNYALETYHTTITPPTPSVDIVVNGHNPFISAATIPVTVANHREEVLGGDISLTAFGHTQTQTNPDDERVPANHFTINSQGSGIISLEMKLDGYLQHYHRAIFAPSGTVETLQNGTNFTVSNGAITFSLDTTYGPTCYSLKDTKGQEWLLSRYPNHEPYGWWNPFLGGIISMLPGMTFRPMLEEETTAQFAQVTDSHGNQWQGICATVTVTKDEKHKGSVCKTYYLTMPGLPLLSVFTKFENGTGQYKEQDIYLRAYPLAHDPAHTQDNLPQGDITTTSTSGHPIHRRLGNQETSDIYFTDTAAIKRNPNEALHIYRSNRHCGQENSFWCDNKIPASMYFSEKKHTPHGSVSHTKPTFFILSGDMPQGAFEDLSRVEF